MIILGYYLIGKTYTAKKSVLHIDLEPKYWMDDMGNMEEGWMDKCFRLATDLSIQGYTVFLPATPELVTYFENSKWDQVIVCYPSPALEEDWINRAEDYLDISDREKRAEFRHIKEKFDVDIERLSESSLPQIAIYDPTMPLLSYLPNWTYLSAERAYRNEDG